MTTYYQYGMEGLITASTVDPVSQYAHEYLGHDMIECEGDIVGTFLARRRAIVYPAYASQQADHLQVPTLQGQGQQCGGGGVPDRSHQDCGFGEGYDSPNYAGNSKFDYPRIMSHVDWTRCSGSERQYPDPEHIRHFHTLHSLLPYIQPERKLNSLDGPVMEIVEQDTGFTFAYSVPKKLLVLFLGRQIVMKFMKTVERQDNENWRGPPICQELHLPRGQTSKIAIKIIVSWMLRACKYHTMEIMKTVQIPKNTFAACSLAQTMTLLGLHKDASRVDMYISQNHFVKPIFAVELETLWNCLGEHNRYVYAAIKVVGKRLQAYDNGQSRELPDADKMLALLEKDLSLNARVRDPELNERYQPVFGTEWMKRLGNIVSTNESAEDLNGINKIEIPRQMGKGTQLANSQNNILPNTTPKTNHRVGVLGIVSETNLSTYDGLSTNRKENRKEMGW
ncbi:uncharacterized protein K460DRAFT_394648 [Cucurbitaria berberidis CBS 394.84]|uniref:Uncharacterized protein n=1 Tax=Cucurbitaria berberidis CBS 394.84 TaxID=1168544 RepID=A0A9P4L812_9PLEO|nr:uncharacterized protein K460DRAFT_394648 [Cucurbitaria berberidis CBS 394.84]KAF1844849.1 hypothetical protein K460DRAFT_394648 [Cucurbitaria berberidis CBS 394.84]